MITSTESTASTDTTQNQQTTATVVEPSSRMVLPPTPPTANGRMMDCSVRTLRSLRDFESLKSERARLETFSLAPGWPITFISPEDCAKAGFFFLQDGDKAQCAFCRGVAGEWEEGDNPAAEHRRHFPRCPFVCNLPVGNIPIEEEVNSTVQTRQQEDGIAISGVDVCGPFQPPSTSLVRGAQPLNGGNMNDVATGLAIKVCGNGPVHNSLVTLQSRLKTFTKWPSNSGQKPEALAEAGFFYIGRMDHVKCFYCDGGLRNWEKEDDPWLEHARWFPNCSFIVLNKGESFVKEVLKAKPTIVPPPPIQFISKAPINPPRRVTDQELRDLIDTPIVQAALEMGMELSKVKAALQRKMQQTGQPFLTTESLLDAVLSRDPEYESDNDTDFDDDDEEEEDTTGRRPNLPLKSLNIISRYGSAGSSEAGSSSSGENSNSSVSSGVSSDDESPTCTTPPPLVKLQATRIPSGDSDSGVSSSGSSDNGEAEAHSSSDTEGNRNSSNEASSPLPTTSSSSPLQQVHRSERESENMEVEVVPHNQEEERELSMEEELRALREATQCKICMDNKVQVVFLPCGHLVSCVRCATALSTCAVCRQPIKAYVKTYLS